MNFWEQFANFKERGEWVELQFMAQAAQHGFAVIKPWGDTLPYDVGIEYGENFLRVQVKSTTAKSGAGYRCQFMPNHRKKHDYSLDQIDLFAAYVIPENAWYLIPAVLLLGNRRKCMAMLCPTTPPVKRASYCYEGYREVWNLLKKSRSEINGVSVQESRRLQKRRPTRTQNGKGTSSLLPSARQPHSGLRSLSKRGIPRPQIAKMNNVETAAFGCPLFCVGADAFIRPGAKRR